jgi:NADPH-dependent ferric siderophore reductase
VGRGKRWGTVAQLRREFAELRERQEAETKRRQDRATTMRQVRASLKRIEVDPAVHPRRPAA